MENITLYNLGEIYAGEESLGECIVQNSDDFYEVVEICEGGLFIAPDELDEKFRLDGRRLDDVKSDSDAWDEDEAEEWEDELDEAIYNLEEQRLTGLFYYDIDYIKDNVLYYDKSNQTFIKGKKLKNDYPIKKILSRWDGHNWVYEEVIDVLEIEAEMISETIKGQKVTEVWETAAGKEFEIVYSLEQGSEKIVQIDNLEILRGVQNGSI
jgi:hypothetical protein